MTRLTGLVWLISVACGSTGGRPGPPARQRAFGLRRLGGGGRGPALLRRGAGRPGTQNSHGNALTYHLPKSHLLRQARVLPSGGSGSSSAAGPRLSHETHRGRPLGQSGCVSYHKHILLVDSINQFARFFPPPHNDTGHPFVAGRVLERLPELRCVATDDCMGGVACSDRIGKRTAQAQTDLTPLAVTRTLACRITADVSHWFVACERLLHCPSEEAGAEAHSRSPEGRLMLLAAERTDHVRGCSLSIRDFSRPAGRADALPADTHLHHMIHRSTPAWGAARRRRWPTCRSEEAAARPRWRRTWASGRR